ncbi:MAG TPA: methyltransferase [Providencia sp.]|uniref:methyltransferase n=1 Tax=Providencia sp. TaxID=589 RepID=UPI000E9B3E10|nr:methyltransferase [Providencia sp.]MBP6081419.1 methyltransferase [Providencia sp.]HBO24951.1 methyltransferase [Providencia sp.]
MNNSLAIEANPGNIDAGLHVIEQATGYTYQAALRAAVILNLADILKTGPKTAQQIALETNTQAPIIKQILRLLATRNIFKTIKGEGFALTPSAEFLLSDHPYSVRQAILMMTDKTFWMTLYELSDMAAGKPVFTNRFKESFYDYWEKNDDNPNGFHEGMSSLSKIENNYIVKSYNFPENITIADIAGGFGGLLLEVLKTNPTTNGILFDREHVLAKNILHLLGDNTRWRVQPGSFFEECPEADIYLLKYISHNWSDEQTVQIFKTIRQAMSPSSKLLLIENIITEDDQPYFGHELGLICTNLSADAGERTAIEFSQLLTLASLKINRIINTNAHHYIIEVLPL